jgi:hypothetical protein
LFVGGNGNGNSYNSGTYYSTSYTAAPTNETVFIVYNLTDATNQFFFTGLQSGGRSISLYNSSPQVFAIGVVGVSWGAVYGSLQMAARTTYLGVAITSGGTNTYAGVNGTLTLTGPTTIGGYTANTTTVIGAALGNQLFTNGYIYEIIAYNSVLSTPQRQTVETYLAQKWGFTASLPLVHPGYKAQGAPLFSVVPYYTAFSPNLIPTCQLWLDASDTTTITGTNPITAWVDKSGKGRAVTITSGPTYGSTFRNGNRTLAFNNNQITTSIQSAVGTGDFTLIAVWYQASAGTNTVLSLGTSQSSSQSLGYSANKYNFYQFGSVQESDYSTSAGNWVIQVGTRISSVKTVYINGYPGTTPSTDSFNQTVTTVTIGKGDTFAISGQVGEILVYTGTMTTPNQQLIESYLSQKWALTNQLPLTHLNTTKPAGLPATSPTPVSFLSFISKFMSTYYNLSGAYSLVNIANSVTASSATPAYVWTVAVPAGAKGKNGILALFFNMYASAFTVGQSFDYGVYVDGVSQLLSDTGTLHYVQSVASTYALSSNGVSMGTNGPVQLLIPMSFATSASQIQIGLKNSSAGFTPVSSALPGYTSNITTSSGTINTSGYNPQTRFTTTGSNYYTVPSNTSAGVPTGVYIYLWGSGGAGSHTNGAGGGFVSGYYSCSPGTNLIYVVGSTAGGTTNGGGGYGGNGNLGGGFSGVFLSNAGGIVQSNAIAIAGGGGGGAIFFTTTRSAGGGGYSNGGALEINNSGVFAYSSVITGGTQTSGGISVNGAQYGSALAGGPAYSGDGGSGGGGGGWYGGGGGGGSGSGGNTGGAGGSGYIGNINGATGGIGLTSSATYDNATDNAIANFTTGSTTRYPGGTSSPYYTTPYGQGNSANSGTGLVVIVPAIGTSATQIGVSAALYSG